MKGFYKPLVILTLLIGVTIFYKEELFPSVYYMQKGDYASKCAAIYSLKEPSLLGQVFKFLMFVNPIDESESELASRIRFFHNLAAEYYQLAGEPSELAEYQADYSIVEYIHQFSELKYNGNRFDADAEILLINCNTTLTDIQKSLKQ